MVALAAGVLSAVLAFGETQASERIPLEARYEYTTMDGQNNPLRVERGSYWRDSKGRVRTTTLSGIVKITDLVSGDWITLYPSERRATLEAIPPDVLNRPAQPPAEPVTTESIERFIEQHVGTVMPDGNVLEDYEYLGVRLIEGIECHAHRTVLREEDGGAVVSEQCYAPAADFTLETRHHIDLADGTTIRKLFRRYHNIRLRQPNPDLFRIPPGYSVTRREPRWAR